VKSSPIPLEQFAASATSLGTAVTLPPAAYTSADFFAFEMGAVWDHSWMCVGRADQVPNPGDYFTATLAGGERVIVVRNNDGDINVMSEVCQHRGMCITAPVKRPRGEWFDDVPSACGTTRNFKCPYHWWIYDLDGKLIGAPDMSHRDDFERSSVRLPQLAVELWQGFVFANFDHDAAPLGPTLLKADKILANYHFEAMVSSQDERLVGMPFNWKLMVENFMEGYHNDRLHHDLYDLSVGDDPANERMTKGHLGFDYEEGDGVLIGTARTAFKDRGLNPTQRGLFPAIETLTEDERWQMVFMFVPPSLLVGISTDSAFWFVVTPTGPETLDMTMSYVHPRATTEMKLFEQLKSAQLAGVELFNDEDLPANTATQVGLRSRFAPRGALAQGDIFLAQFNMWLLERYRAAEEAAGQAAGQP
jgi:phenylpropionate dioxygenase-like ring-hydroxylating dioxygenase large terminal subunit